MPQALFSTVLRCVIALGIGLCVDFARVPPILLMDLCVTRNGTPLAMLASHLQMFPASSAAVLLVVVPRYVRRGQLLRLPLAVAECIGMLASMMVCMALFKHVAALLGWSWGPDGWACAMVTGMIAFDAGSRCGGLRLKPGTGR